MSTKGKPQNPDAQPQGRGKRAVFWLAGSALLGSVAIALWNRRALSRMHEAADDPVEPPSRTRDEDGIY